MNLHGEGLGGGEDGGGGGGEAAGQLQLNVCLAFLHPYKCSTSTGTCPLNESSNNNYMMGVSTLQKNVAGTQATAYL